MYNYKYGAIFRFFFNFWSANYYNIKLTNLGNLAQADTFGIKSIILGYLTFMTFFKLKKKKN